jgi:hypothetical protein
MSHPPAPTEPPAPVFWKEVYGLIAIVLGSGILFLAIIPPKAKRYWSLAEHEAKLIARNRGLEEQVRRFDEATMSLETDSFFRDAVLRERLGVKKRSETYLPQSGTDASPSEPEQP